MEKNANDIKATKAEQIFFYKKNLSERNTAYNIFSITWSTFF